MDRDVGIGVAFAAVHVVIVKKTTSQILGLLVRHDRSLSAFCGKLVGDIGCHGGKIKIVCDTGAVKQFPDLYSGAGLMKNRRKLSKECHKAVAGPNTGRIVPSPLQGG